MTATMDDIRSFVNTMLLDGGCYRQPMTDEEAAYNMSQWDIDGVEYPEGMDPRDLAHVWNNAVRNAGDHELSALEIRANSYHIPFHGVKDDLLDPFLSDHVIPYRDHVLCVFHRYNNKAPDDSWCLAVYTFDNADHTGDGLITLRTFLYQCYDDPGCALKVGLQIADGKKY